MRKIFNWVSILLLVALEACIGPGQVKPAHYTPPSIQTQPASLTVVEPSPATLSVVASGSAPLAYKWFKNGSEIAGATLSTLTFDPSHPSDSGTYTVVVDNITSQPVTSSAVLLTVTAAPPGPPQILQQPQSLTVTAPAAASFQVVATGTLPLTFQWRKNGVNIPGATARIFTINPTTVASAGNYTVVVHNATPPDAVSQIATLTVKQGLLGVFTPTAGSLGVGRAQHTATLLGDGRVLIIGGNTFSGVTSSAERYDPTTDQFTTLPATLQISRFDHTATLLNNGKVLLAGGTGLFGLLTSAELFDPATGLFTRTIGDLQTGRSQHTATLLADGRVLLAGGQGTFGPLSSAELFDPATGRFTTRPGPCASGGPSIRRPSWPMASC